MSTTLVKVSPKNEFHVSFLYYLLALRPPEANISHKKFPAYMDHVTFVNLNDYTAWYLIEDGEEFIGSIYLTARDEIGIQIIPECQGEGHGKAAIAELMRLNPRRRYLANIAYHNTPSKKFFYNLNFRPIQVTYELRNPDSSGD